MSPRESTELAPVHDHVRELLEVPAVAEEAARATNGITQRFDLCLMGRPISRAIRPKLVTERGYADAAATAGAVCRVVRRLGERVLVDPALKKELGLPPAVAGLLEVDPTSFRGRVVARVDGAIDECDVYRVMELNPRFPGGLYYSDELAAIAEGTELWRQLGGRFALRRQLAMETLAAALVSGNGAAKPRLFFPDGEGVEAEWAAQIGFGDALLAVSLSRQFGFPLRSGRPDELELGDRVRHRGEVVDLILTIPVEERLGELLAPFGGRDAGLPERLETAKIGIFNTVSLATAMDSKAHLAVISDEATSEFLDGASSDDVARARAAIPWTRRVRPSFTQREGKRVDLVEHLSANREQFVLKPAISLGGRGVVLGWQTSAADWDRALADDSEVLVAQERVRLTPEPWPVLEDGGSEIRWVETPSSLDVFVWNDRDPRCAIGRLMIDGMMNASKGSSMVPVTIVGADT